MLIKMRIQPIHITPILDAKNSAILFTFKFVEYVIVAKHDRIPAIFRMGTLSWKDKNNSKNIYFLKLICFFYTST